MRNKAIRGFTLIEMLIVVAIIGILAALLGGVFISMANRAANDAAANQIKKILGACEQFKEEFGAYPTVDAKASASGSNLVTVSQWMEDNALAFKLCQNPASTSSNNENVKDKSGSEVYFANHSRADPETWAGSYLTEDDVSSDLIEDRSCLLDYWGRPLAYCAQTSQYIQDKRDGKLNPNSLSTSWATGSSLTSQSANNNTSGTSTDYICYKSNRQFYARPKVFMGPVSYALKGTWSDAEVNMPEIWSIGDDGEYAKLQYNKSDSNFKIKVGSIYPDEDNVGGNINVMKIQK